MRGLSESCLSHILGYNRRMDPEDRRLLSESLKLAEDNNRMLRKLYGAMKWGRVMRLVYWLVILSLSLGVFYFIQPYVDKISMTLRTAYENLNELGETLKDIKR